MMMTQKVSFINFRFVLITNPYCSDDDDDTDDDEGTFAAIGEEFLAGFFEDDTTKKPVVAAVAPLAAVAAAPAVPAKQPTPAEILTNEVIPEAPLSVIPVEVVSENGEKLVEPVADIIEAVPEKVEVMTTLNDPIPVVEGEVLETASSEVIAPVVAAVASPETPAAAPVKADSEEEGLIEGIVNTFIGDGKLFQKIISEGS